MARVEIGSLLDLYVASAADTVVQIPSGNYLLGLVSRRQYYRELLDTLGIEFEAFHTGPYKTAMSGYTATGMSAQEREAIETLLDDLYEQLVAGIAADRDLDPAAVRDAIDAELKKITGELDHRLLNEVEGLEHPSLEDIAMWVFNKLDPVLTGLVSVEIRRPSWGEKAVVKRG